MNFSEVLGLAGAIVVLAGVSVAIINGDKTAKVIAAGGKAFTDSLRVATRGGK